MKNLLTIFFTFLKIGAFTFGGGYAMIPLIQKEAVEHHHWVTDSDILDIVAIAESTPGPIAINAATFVGYQTKGFSGAVAATLGVVLPSFLTIFAIFHVLQAFQNAPVVQYAFNGIRVGVLVLMLKALLKMFKTNPKGALPYTIMGAAFVLTAINKFGIFKINMIFVIIGCAVFGLVTSLAMERRAAK